MLIVHIDDKVYRFPLLCLAMDSTNWAIVEGEEIAIIGIVEGNNQNAKFQVIDYLRLTDTPWQVIHIASSTNWIAKHTEKYNGNLDKYLVRDCPYHTNNPNGGEPIVPNNQCPKCDPYR